MSGAVVLAVGYLSIDAIETPSARREDVAGGAALYAALGAKRAGALAAIAACVGADYPAEWLTALLDCGIEIDRIERRPGPTRRARLAHAASGARQSDYAELWWDRTAALAPPRLSKLDGVTTIVAGPMPFGRLEELCSDARAAGVPLVADTSEAFAAGEREQILSLLPKMAAFAPSREETRLLLPGLGDDEAALALARRGPAVLQKRGREGAFAVPAGGASGVALEAPNARVCDPTGAGDAATGALAAALAAGKPFVDAARAALTVGACAVSGVGPAALGFSTLAQDQGLKARRLA